MKRYNYKFNYPRKNLIFNILPMKCELLVWKNTLKHFVKSFRWKHFLSIPYFYVIRIVLLNKILSDKIKMSENMKVVILCGGIGSRLAEETKLIPKPMVKLDRKPIVEHIINIYKFYGFKEFILATGYKSEIIEKYFKKKKGIKCIFTGLETSTGGRILRLKKFFRKDEVFLLTYGDGVTNHNINKSLSFHLKHKKIATLTSVKPPARSGKLNLMESR